jgi:hypothetical protein
MTFVDFTIDFEIRREEWVMMRVNGVTTVERPRKAEAKP